MVDDKYTEIEVKYSGVPKEEGVRASLCSRWKVYVILIDDI